MCTTVYVRHVHIFVPHIQYIVIEQYPIVFRQRASEIKINSMFVVVAVQIKTRLHLPIHTGTSK